jgi:hypothetical protein
MKRTVMLALVVAGALAYCVGVASATSPTSSRQARALVATALWS